MPLHLQGRPHHEIAVGLDIGATYTKVSYILPSSRDPVSFTFQHGFRLQTLPSTVVPTTLFYNSQGLPLGCGYDAIPGAEQLRFFKYTLLPESHWHPEAKQWSALAHSVQVRTQLQKTAVDVMIDYINQFWSVCGPRIRYLQQSPDDQQSLRLTVGFPPGWPEDLFQQALRNSVLLNSKCEMRLITEADAAMEYVLSKVADGTMGNIDLKIGEHIIVADCGSVTVDTVCGTITSTNGNLDYHRVTPATSELCGSAIMTDSFTKTLALTAGTLLTDPAVLGPEFWEEAVQRWETDIMPNFTSEAHDTWTFRLPKASLQAVKPGSLQTHSLWLENGVLPLHSADIGSIFHLAVKKITSQVHTHAQVIRDKTGRSPKYVFFTGGFSLNPYLASELRASIKNISVKFPMRVQHLQAVAHGAAIRAMKESRAQSVIAERDFDIEADGKTARLIAKGESMSSGRRKHVLLPWNVIQPSYTGGGGVVRLSITSRIEHVAQVLCIVNWRPRQPVTSDDIVHIEMCCGANSVEVVEWAFWHNGLRQSGAPDVWEERPGA